MANGIQYRVDKCKIMHIGNSNKNFKYCKDKKELEKVQEEKDLGVLIMVALCNRADHYIFILFLFSSSSSFFFFFFLA